MAKLTRREFGRGVLAAGLGSLIPFDAALRAAGLTASCLSADLKEAAEALQEDYRLCLFGEANEDPHREFEYLNDDTGCLVSWCSQYQELITAGDWVRDAAVTGSPEERAVLAWARKLIPPPCECALTFWSPIPGLSEEGKKRSRAYFAARARSALAHWDYMIHCTTENLLYVEDAPGFAERREVCRKAEDAFYIAQGAVLDFWGGTNAGDRELRRRAMRCYGESGMLDIPYVKARVPDWKRGLRPWERVRCGALPCAACDRWLS